MDKLTKVIPVRFSDEQWEKIKAIAESQGRTASDLIRWIVNKHLNEKEQQESEWKS